MDKQVPQYEVVPLLKNSGLLIREFKYEKLEVDWHSHSEYEITYIKKGSGKRIIGNNLSAFKPGDLVLIGPDLPHLYKEEKVDKDKYSGAVCQVIQFDKELFNKQFLSFNELSELHGLLVRSNSGLCFTGEIKETAAKLISRMLRLKGSRLFINFLQLLFNLARSQSFEVLNLDRFTLSESFSSEKGRKIYKYILDHYTENIKIDQMAKIANLSKTAFCNYFKKKTKKRFSHFINELRCDLAYKLLTETDNGVAQIAYMTGYNNLSYFNRQFTELFKKTPKEVRKNSK